MEILKEKNYFFRMSQFEQALLDLYEAQPDFVQPESVRNEIIQFVKQGLSDLSISRSSFDWGIKVPWDDTHVVYVWFEALLNYITAVGYGTDEAQFERRWPAVNLVGKDIARFHAVIWPAMLMAADLPVPARVFGHGWLLVGGEKMSKSKLTGIAPEQITDTFGSDAFRYYFLRAISFGQDGSFSWEDLSARYQAELANGFGNLASRVIAMVSRYFDGVVPAPSEYADADLAIQRTVADAVRRRGCRDRSPRHPRGDRRGLDDRRGAQRIHHRAGTLGARQGSRRRSHRLGDRAVHGIRGTALARRAAQPGDPAGDREALDRARGRGADWVRSRRSRSARRATGAAPGRQPGSARSRHSSRASKPMT